MRLSELFANIIIIASYQLPNANIIKLDNQTLKSRDIYVGIKVQIFLSLIMKYITFKAFFTSVLND